MIMITTHAGKLVNLDHADHGRAYQKLVSQRIHKFSKIGYQIIFLADDRQTSLSHLLLQKSQDRYSGLLLLPSLSQNKTTRNGTSIILATVSLFGVFICQLSYQIILQAHLSHVLLQNLLS